MAEEFNKYLSYVRNLGFEDTPDYDYLRELFTQALKNTGEVEDGEYDWMKLNGGKGWEALKHSSQHLHVANAAPNSSARALGGGGAGAGPAGTGADTPRGGAGTPGVSRLHMNSAQAIPGSPAKPSASKPGRDRPAAAAGPLKRQSAHGGGINDLATPTGSTTANYGNSTANLGQHRISTAAQPGVSGGGGLGHNTTVAAGGGPQPGMGGGGGPGTAVGQANRALRSDEQGGGGSNGGGGFQKFLRVICCSR